MNIYEEEGHLVWVSAFRLAAHNGRLPDEALLLATE